MLSLNEGKVQSTEVLYKPHAKPHPQVPNAENREHADQQHEQNQVDSEVGLEAREDVKADGQVQAEAPVAADSAA